MLRRHHKPGHTIGVLVAVKREGARTGVKGLVTQNMAARDLSKIFNGICTVSTVQVNLA